VELQTTLVADRDNRHQFMALGNLGILPLWSAAHLIGGVGHSDHNGFGLVFGMEGSFAFVLRIRVLIHLPDLFNFDSYTSPDGRRPRTD